jgi:hypothetical protein
MGGWTRQAHGTDDHLPPGLEEVAAAELTALGASEVRPGRLHLRARLPFRLLRTLAHFPCDGGLAAQFADTDRAQPIRAGCEQAPMPLMQAGQPEKPRDRGAHLGRIERFPLNRGGAQAFPAQQGGDSLLGQGRFQPTQLGQQLGTGGLRLQQQGLLPDPGRGQGSRPIASGASGAITPTFAI